VGGVADDALPSIDHAHLTQEELVVVLYPDSGKIGVAERLPRGGGLSEYYRREDAVGYWEGETPPGPDEVA
jgi:hypothetical protein